MESAAHTYILNDLLKRWGLTLSIMKTVSYLWQVIEMLMI